MKRAISVMRSMKTWDVQSADTPGRRPRTGETYEGVVERHGGGACSRSCVVGERGLHGCEETWSRGWVALGFVLMGGARTGFRVGRQVM